MRYVTPVYFQRFLEKVYNYETGNYGTPELEEVLRYANVTTVGVKFLNSNYAKLSEGSKVIRLQQQYDGAFDSIRIGDKTYKIATKIPLNHKQTFIVNEVQ